MYVRLARHPLVLAVVFATYFGLGRLGQFPVPTLGTAPVWPASGFALAAFLLLGRPIWPAVLLASFLVQFSGTGSLVGAIIVSLGNTAEGLLAAALIRRYASGAQAFLKAETIFRFAGIAAICMAIGATTGSVAEILAASDMPAAQLAYLWMAWWLSHVTGCLVIAPLILLWSPPLPERMRVLEMIEAVGLLAGLIGVGLLVFGGRYPSDVKDYPLEFLCVPFFLWAAFRFGRREVASAMAILAGVAVWGSAQGFGPFVRDTPQESLVLIQAYICTMSIMVTVLAATVAGRKAAEAKLEELALTDPLTGLANYRRLLEVLRVEIARSNRTRRPLTVLLLDMNGLKRINDRFGHLTGSRALVRLGNVLRRASRTIDTPARFGGDEFVIVLPDTPNEGGAAVLRRIEEQLAADTDSPPLSVSGGVATFPEDGETPTLLLRHADAQLYDSKTRSQRSRRSTAGDEESVKKAAKLF